MRKLLRSIPIPWQTRSFCSAANSSCFLSSQPTKTYLRERIEAKYPTLCLSLRPILFSKLFIQLVAFELLDHLSLSTENGTMTIRKKHITDHDRLDFFAFSSSIAWYSLMAGPSLRPRCATRSDWVNRRRDSPSTSSSINRWAAREPGIQLKMKHV